MWCEGVWCVLSGGVVLCVWYGGMEVCGVGCAQCGVRFGCGISRVCVIIRKGSLRRGMRSSQTQCMCPHSKSALLPHARLKPLGRYENQLVAYVQPTPPVVVVRGQGSRAGGTVR